METAIRGCILLLLTATLLQASAVAAQESVTAPANSAELTQTPPTTQESSSMPAEITASTTETTPPVAPDDTSGSSAQDGTSPSSRADLTQPLLATALADAAAIKDETHAQIARYTITLQPPNASLFVDGTKVSLSDGFFMLEAGEHVLEARAPHHRSVQRTLHADAGNREHLTIALTRTAASPTSHTSKRWLLWTSLGAAIVAGTATGLALSMKDASQHGFPTTTGTVIAIPSQVSSSR